MAWQKLQFVVQAQDEKRLVSMLEGFLASAVTSENAGGEDHFDEAFPSSPNWQTVKVSALFDEAVDTAPIVEFIRDHHDLDMAISLELLKDQDWERVCLDQFKPFSVDPTNDGAGLWVCPTWSSQPKQAKTVVLMDPGLAFGSGTHATTRLCLQWIEQAQLASKRVLDFGAGSGILAIAALKCGAQSALAVDIDPEAVTASTSNARVNDVSERFSTCLNADYVIEKHDLVIANILANTLITLAETLVSSMSDSGKLLLSGVLEHQAAAIIQHYNTLGVALEAKQLDEWILLVGEKKLVPHNRERFNNNKNR